MKLPISWLKEYIDLDVSLEELERKLFSSGFEVEEVIYVGKEITNCVVGLITHIEKHPDSDHLQICKLNCGTSGENIQIVTGAQNVFVGAKVPVALNNSTLAGGVKIKNGKLRGVESNGMLCSGGELGIDENYFDGAGVDGILILPEDTEIGTDIKKVVGLDDYIFDLSITANRPDAQSVFGMAREISAILSTPLKKPALFYNECEEDLPLDVDVFDSDLCPRYIAHVVKDIKLETSPVWLRQRLIMSDIQPKNVIVDITNYVLLELGQPMHAFDYSKLNDNQITVRRANSGEKITTLDEKEFSLTENNLVICDGRAPVALAGIMGGLESGINDNTKTVVFESAKFIRENIRKTSRTLGQSSDSSRRFEKGVDKFTTEMAMKRALHLVDALKAGKVTTIHFDKNASHSEEKQVITTTISKINSILGITVSPSFMKDILTRLDFEVTIDGDKLSAAVPLYREDLEGANDIAEEIIRIYGFENITPKLLLDTHITKGGLTSAQKWKFKLKEALASQGYSEIITYSFFGEKDLDLINLPQDAIERNFVKIANPLTEDVAIMKTTLVPSTLSIINKNLKKGVEEGKIFEVASVFIPTSQPVTTFPIEKQTLSMGLFGDKQTFFDIKGALDALAREFKLKFEYQPCQKPYFHPYQAANILLNGTIIGYVGKLAYEISEKLSLNTPIFIAQLDYELFMNEYKDEIIFESISKHNDIKRDLALVVDNNITCGEIEKVIESSSKKISKIELFDIYTGMQLGENKKSMAFSITFTPKEEPLTHEEVDKYIDKILKNLKQNLNIEIR